jgi:dolichol-phosphate mannosyltransferase
MTTDLASSLASILIPVYNNAGSLRALVSRIVVALEAACIPFEIVLVDDGSLDSSWSILCELADAEPRIKALRLSRNFGQHAAISAALEHARGSRFVLMDADLQDRPEMIPDLLQALAVGDHDVVYTAKVGGGDSLLQRLTSHAFHGAVSKATDSRMMSGVGTFRAFNRKVADALGGYREHGIVYGPLMHTLGYDTICIPVARDPRAGSRSSYSFTRRFALAFRSLVSYSTLPQRALLWMGGTISAASVLYLVAIVIQHLLGGPSLAQGLTLIVVLMLFLIGIVMFSLGVLASYLFLIYHEVLARPRYHLQQSRNLESGR